MKKLVIIILVMIIVATMLTLVSCTVRAEEVSQEEPQPSAMAAWFDQKIAPYIVNFATVLSGFLVALAPLIAVLKKIKNTSDKLTKSSASVLAENALVVQENTSHKAKIVKLEKRLLQQEQDISDIKAMCKIAFTNDHNLVANGYAHEIATICAKGVAHEESQADAD